LRAPLETHNTTRPTHTGHRQLCMDFLMLTPSKTRSDPPPPGWHCRLHNNNFN
jgi:hypothetical protein